MSLPESAAVSILDEDQDAEAQLALMGVSLEGVMAELRYRRQRKIAEAYRIQALAAKRNGERRTLHTADGGGEVTMQIHPVFYHYWGHRLGYDCWKDPQFNREMLRDNPELRIKNHVRTHGAGGTIAQAASRRRITGKRGRWAA